MLDAVAAVNELKHGEFVSVTMATEDSDLVRRCQKGDQAAFRDLVERYRQKAYWIAYDIVSHRETARDISQEAFIRAFNAIGTFNPDNSFEGWMRRIVTNLSIDELRSRTRRRDVSLEALTSEVDLPSQRHGPDKLAEAQEERELVIQILDKLPAKYRTVLALREINGMSYEEVAQAISRPTATARWRIHNARRLFKDLWEKHAHRTRTHVPRRAEP